jgi:predicted RNA-binding Zn ribbon-like protein
MALISSSGQCVPPGPSRKASGRRRAEKRSRTERITERPGGWRSLGVRAANLPHIRRVREAFRVVLVANAAGERADQGVRVLNDVAAEAGVAMRLSGPGSATPVVATGGVAGALGELVAIAFEAIAAGTWTRLKACPAGGCHWASTTPLATDPPAGAT